MKKIIAVCVALSLPAFAQEKEKELCLTPQEQVTLARNIVDLKAQNAQLKKEAGVAVPTVIAFVIAGAALGVASTVAVYEIDKAFKK